MINFLIQSELLKIIVGEDLLIIAEKIFEEKFEKNFEPKVCK